MNDASSMFLIGQLVNVVPTMLVFAMAAVLAFVFWGRARTASILTLVSVVISSAVVLIVPLIQTSFVHAHKEGAMDSDAFSTSMSAVAFAGSFVRTVGLGLLVAAVFVGRTRATPRAESAVPAG